MSDTSAASAFGFPGTTAEQIAMKITGTGPTVFAGDAASAQQVAWFQVTERAGGTASLTIDLFDGTTAYIINNLAAMTARGEYLYGRGFWLPPGWFLRVTTGSANQVDVVGLATIPARL
jgi:hypothetical protein